MKKFAQNLSFLKTLSVYIIFSSFGINSQSCKASDDRGEIVDTDGTSAIILDSVLLSSSAKPVMRSIPLPTPEELRKRNFWHELIQLDQTHEGRKQKIQLLEKAVPAVLDFSLDIEDFFSADEYSEIFLGKKFTEILSEETTTAKLILMRADQTYEMLDVHTKLLEALKNWQNVVDGFFSFNKALVLLRKRILEDFEREQQMHEREELLKSQVRLLTDSVDENKKIDTVLSELMAPRESYEKRIENLTEDNKTLTSANSELQAKILALELQLKEAQGLLAQTAVPQYAPNDLGEEIPVPQKITFWQWIKSLFYKSTEPNEKTRLINSDENV